RLRDRLTHTRSALERPGPTIGDLPRPLIMAPAHRALRASEQVADGFFVPSPDPNSSETSRLQQLWNARRNTTHGFDVNAQILAQHHGSLPADIVFVPIIYLLDILTNREALSGRIKRSLN
ncbi:hypothetical protein ACNHUS_36450, partial [Actinomycetes bacterium M1A6_2h]